MGWPTTGYDIRRGKFLEGLCGLHNKVEENNRRNQWHGHFHKHLPFRGTINHGSFIL
ncbi:Uncharacterised protein [Yersinia enterocolitica]|nr:Uncharacterised protein [Yersinia enterocolitica]